MYETNEIAKAAFAAGIKIERARIVALIRRGDAKPWATRDPRLTPTEWLIRQIEKPVDGDRHV